MTPLELTEVLTVIELGWPRNWPDNWEAVFSDLLIDLPGPETLAALRRIAMVDEYPPSVARIRRAVAEDLELLPDPEESATRAIRWAYAVQQALFRQSDDIPDAPDQVTEKAVFDFGGYQAVLDSEDNFRRFWRRTAAAERDRILGSKGLGCRNGTELTTGSSTTELTAPID